MDPRSRWAARRRVLVAVCVVLGVAAATLLALADSRTVRGASEQVLVGALLVVLPALAIALVLTGLLWARGGRSPTPGVLVALGGAVLLPASLGAAMMGAGASLGGLGLAAVWVVAGTVARAVSPPATGVRPVARPAVLERRPWWLVVRLVSVLALLGLLVWVGWWAGQAFSLFPGKERGESLDEIRRAAAWQWRTMLLGAVPLVLLWWLSLRRQAAALVLAAAAFLGSMWSVVGFAAALPVALTAVVLLFLPPRRERATEDVATAGSG